METRSLSHMNTVEAFIQALDCPDLDLFIENPYVSLDFQTDMEKVALCQACIVRLTELQLRLLQNITQNGFNAESNHGPPAPKAGIMPLDH